jgi:hypothetical protein
VEKAPDGPAPDASAAEALAPLELHRQTQTAIMDLRPIIGRQQELHKLVFGPQVIVHRRSVDG